MMKTASLSVGVLSVSLAALVACDGGTQDQPTPEISKCALGGDFLVGPPAILGGGCAGHLPTAREFGVLPTDNPARYLVKYAGAELSALTDLSCVATAAAVGFPAGDLTGLMAATVSVSGDRLDAIVDYRLSGLPVGDECDVRLGLVGHRTLRQGGNPTGGDCGLAATCAGALCAYGDVAACTADVCVVTNTIDGAASYCSEPCEIGSCPAGYECADAGAAVFGRDGGWYCVLLQPVCGDGARGGHEACDDGNSVGGDGCAADCRSDESCGNGVVDLAAGELCDDGDRFAGDGCSAYCQTERCGNGKVDLAAGELCDDGNNDDGDGCSADCWLEACGNGTLDAGEACDDGNLVDTDGCDGFCRGRPENGSAAVEPKWVHTIAGAETARIVSYRGLSLFDRGLFVWTESYAGGGPFAATLETYAAWVDPDLTTVQPPVRLADAQGFVLESLVVLRDTHVVALMRQGAALALAVSDDGGASFAPKVEIAVPGLAEHAQEDAFARLFSDGRTLYLTVGLTVAGAAANRNLFFSRSADGGRSWSLAVRLSQPADFNTWATPPKAVADPSGALVIVWGDGPVLAGDVFAARSVDGGETWLRPTEPVGRHAAGRRAETLASLAIGIGDLIVAFAGPDGIQLARWAGDATPWRVSTVLAPEVLGTDIGELSLAASPNGRLQLSFAAGGSMWTTLSRDGGAHFATPQRVGALASGVSQFALGASATSISTDPATGSSDHTVLVWLADLQIDTHRGWAALGVESLDGGRSWSQNATPLVAAGALGDPGTGGLERFDVGTHHLALVSSGGNLWLYDMDALRLGAPWAAPTGSAGVGCATALAGGGWCTPSTLDAPRARGKATVVAAGGDLIFFGGDDGFGRRADGGIYDVAADRWRPIDAGRPGTAVWGRTGHSVVWTGSEMLLFGGHNGMVVLGDGWRYDPAIDLWQPLPAGAPPARTEHTAVWTGTEMLVFGGLGTTGPLATGGRLVLSTGEWLPMHSATTAVYGHSAVWTGAEMLVFGGKTVDGFAADGFRYRPSDNVVLPLPVLGEPSARAHHSACWTGTHMAVWGGDSSSGALADGGLYDFGADDWSKLPTAHAPSERSRQVAAWTGALWLLWGGVTDQSGASYSLAGGFASLPTADAPAPRFDAAAAWAGDRWVIFGGVDALGNPLADGGIYVP
ncbi:MAG: DUF4215 domain-containing protein [Deltaproteobacteria bacterium]|nr:DUF4215 domain-containing protein [Deltaproteobacteria bacterium]